MGKFGEWGLGFWIISRHKRKEVSRQHPSKTTTNFLRCCLLKQNVEEEKEGARKEKLVLQVTSGVRPNNGPVLRVRGPFLLIFWKLKA